MPQPDDHTRPIDPREILDRLPPATYSSLPWAQRTVADCMTTVLEAYRLHNPRRIRDWVDAERSTPPIEALLECLDTVLGYVFPAGNSPEGATFVAAIHAEVDAALRVRLPQQAAPIESELAQIIATALLRNVA